MEVVIVRRIPQVVGLVSVRVYEPAMREFWEQRRWHTDRMPFAVGLSVILLLVALFQIALAAGAPWGRLAWGGAHEVLPARLRIGSLVSVLIYAVIAVIAFARVGASAALPHHVAVIAMWVVFGYFSLGILMNAISRSRPERVVMTPTVTVLAVLSLLIALGVGSAAGPA